MSTTSSNPTPWELGVAYILHSWPALTLAVSSQWGGPNSEEKRDWLCGAIADMFPSLDETLTNQPDPTGEDNGEPDDFDVEETLAQVMQDEFEVTIEDDSVVPIAKKIMQLRTSLLQGNFGIIDVLRDHFERNKDKAVPVARTEDDGEEEEDSDEEMGDADEGVVDSNNAGSASERSAPVVDEDGFELVQNRRKR